MSAAKIKEWLLTETNQRRLEEEMPEAAVIPTAAIEPHNLHLPLGQDFFHTLRIVNLVWKGYGKKHIK